MRPILLTRWHGPRMRDRRLGNEKRPITRREGILIAVEACIGSWAHSGRFGKGLRGFLLNPSAERCEAFVVFAAASGDCILVSANLA